MGKRRLIGFLVEQRLLSFFDAQTFMRFKLLCQTVLLKKYQIYIYN